MKAYNKAMKNQKIQEGDLVLKMNDFVWRKVSPSLEFYPHWECPFIVKEAYESGYYWQMNINGVTHHDPINGK